MLGRWVCALISASGCMGADTSGTPEEDAALAASLLEQAHALP